MIDDAPKPRPGHGIEWSWKVDIPTIITILAGAGALLVWSAQMQAQMDRQDERLAIVERRLDSLPEKVAIIEERTQNIDRSLARIEAEISTMNRSRNGRAPERRRQVTRRPPRAQRRGVSGAPDEKHPALPARAPA